MVWAVLLCWLAEEIGLPLERHAKRLLESELVRLPEPTKAKLLESLEFITTGRKLIMIKS
jgi:hypothetical protein